ncbi:serine-rich adhesin for platelets-like [Octopus vulgaris]|uniref:Serine-rich adhesin for platelets-like n=1 Tax=Octopus vulgaris TaxID=6645 RepID=A0AA36BVV9_OCTVU|nr:serine-rich adhesin for platelets-like [Octopus vulgaris]
MAECETEKCDNHFDERCPAGKLNSNEENGKKGKEKLDIASSPSPVSGDFNKIWSPSSVNFSDNDDDDDDDIDDDSARRLLALDSVDYVGSSDCTQPLVVECDSVQSSQVQQQQQQQQQHDTKAAHDTTSHLHCNNIDKTTTPSTKDGMHNTSNSNNNNNNSNSNKTTSSTPQSLSPLPSPTPPATTTEAAKASATMITTTKEADGESLSEEEHGSYVNTRVFVTSPETSICAVSSTVEDDDEKDCRTVSSSLSADGPVVAGKDENFSEDHESSLVLPASSTLTAELLQKEEMYIGQDAENQRKKSKSSVAELLLSSPTSCTDYGKNTHSNEAMTLDNNNTKKKNVSGADKFQLDIHQSDNVSEMVNDSGTPQQFRNNEIISNSKDDTDGSEKSSEGLESSCTRIANALEESFSNLDQDQFEAKLYNVITSKASCNNNGQQVESAFKEGVREKGVNMMDGSKQSELSSDMQEVSVLSIEGETNVPISSTVSKNSAIVNKEQSSPLDFSKFQECKSKKEEKSNSMEVTADVSDSSRVDESGKSANTNASNSSKPEIAADSKKVTSNGERKRKFCEPLLSVIEKATKNFSVNISAKLDAIATTTSTSTTAAKCPKISSDLTSKSDSRSITASPLLTLRTPTINSLVSSSSSSLSSSPSPSSSSPSLTFSPPLIATSSSSPPLQPPAPAPNAASSSVLSSGKSSLVETILSYDNGLYACSHCSFSGKQSAFEDHLFSHMENYAFKCDDCTSEFKSPSQWQQHVLSRHKGQHHLPKYMSLLIKEIRASNDQKLNFQCPEASRSPSKHRQTHPADSGAQTSKHRQTHLAADPGAQISKSSSEPFSVTNNTDSSQSPKQFSDKHRAFCKDLEVTFVNNEYVCLQCAKKSKDKEIFRFHLWTHTHSAESSYCCCTTLTRESCEVVANILQLVTDTNTTETESEDSTKKTVVICRIRKSDLKLETISKMASEVKNLSVALPLLVGAEVKNSSCPSKLDQASEHSNSSLTTDADKISKQTEGAANKDAKSSVNCKKRDIQELKETVIVENPLRAATHQLKVLKTSLADQGCEKIPDLKSISVTNQIENNTSSGKMADENRSSKVTKKENSDFAMDFSLVKVKSEQPDEEYLLEDINRKIMNIKKEVKEFTALTNMLCDISSSDGSLLDLKKELSDDQDMALDLKISSPPSLTSSNIYKDSNAGSSFPSFTNDSLSLSMTVNNAENLSVAGENHAVAGMDKDLKGAFYKCGFNGCGFASMNSTQFRAHLETAHKYVSSYPCAHCGHVAPSEDNLLRHMQTHSNSKIFLLFKCAFAGCRFGTNLIHEFRDHNEIFHKDEKTCSCLNCKQVFVELSELLNHLRTNLLKFIQCPHCSVKDRNRRAVLNHISEAHPGKPKQIVVTSQVVCQEKQASGTADNKALLADHANSLQLAPFPSKNDIEYLETKLKPKELLSALHLTNDMYPFSKTFSAISDSKNHSSTIPKNQYSCKLCKYTTSQSPLLENHVRNYHPSFLGEYIARHIGKESSKSLTSESKQKLGITDLEAASSVSKNSNQLKSSEETPFVNKAIAKACCHLCPVAYKHVQQLKTHVRVKHPECQILNFLKCVHCNAKSTSKEYLVTSCKKRHPKKEFHFTHIQEVLNSNKNESEMLDLIVNPSRQEYNSSRRCEHGNLSSCFQCELKNSNSSNDWKVPLFKDQPYEGSTTDSVKPFVCKVFKNMVRPTKTVNQSPILTVPSAKGSLQKNTTKSKSSSEKKSAASTLDTDFSSALPPCEIGSQTLDSKLSVLYTRNRKWNRCKCCQFTTDHVATIHHHILDCHLKLYLWSCPYCELRSIKKQNIIQHCLHFHENKKPGAKFESQDWNKDIRNILNLLPKDTSASTFTKQTFIISGPSSETPNCYRLATEPLTIPTSLTKPNRPTVVKLSNGVYKCSVCSTKGFVEWQVQKHIETEHSSELKASGANGSGSSIVLDFGKQTSGNSSDASKDIPRSDTKQIPEGSVKHLEAQSEDIELQNLSNPSSKDEEMKAMARKIIEVSAGVLQCPFCSYKSRLRTCVKCHIWSQHMMLKRKRCKHCSFASWFDNGIEAHMATEHPRLCFGSQTAKAGYTVLVEEPDGTWKEMAVNFVRSSKEDVAFRKRPLSKESESNSKSNSSNKKAKKAISNSNTSKALSIYTSDSSSQLLSNTDKTANDQNTSEVLNLSKSSSSSIELKVSKPNALMSSKSQKTSLQSSLKTNKTVKPALVISPKFFKMSKSGALNLSKSATKAELTGSTPISSAKPSVINVPKFKASDPLKYQRDVKKMDDDPYESSSSGNSSSGSSRGGQRSYYWSGEAKSGTSIMSLVKGSRDKNRPGQVSSSSSSSSSSNNNSSGGGGSGSSSSSTRKAMPDSLITINTRMEEMCVREFDENLMQYTFTCTICSYRSTNRTTFNSHTYSHKPPAFKCGYCPFRANPRCRVTAHIRKYHKEPLIKIINLSSTPKRAIDKVPSLTKEEATALAQQRKLKILEKSKDLENNEEEPLTGGANACKSDKINNNSSKKNNDNNNNKNNNNNNNNNSDGNNNSSNNNNSNSNAIGKNNNNMMMIMKKKKKKKNTNNNSSSTTTTTNINNSNDVNSIGSDNDSDGLSDSSLEEFGTGPYGMDYDDDEEFDNSLDGSDHEEEEEDLYSSLTFCCNACSFQTNDIDRFTKHTSLHNFFTHGMKVACMDCPFSTNQIVQYEEHISRHIEGFLFYCGCCSFSSVEEQEVREHSLKKHPDRVISIEISPSPPSSLSTKWSPVDLDPFVELTDFLAMDCERFYNLISHHGVTMVDLKSTAVSYEDLNVKSSSEDEDDIDDIDDDDDEAEDEEGRVSSGCDLESLLDDVDENDGGANGDKKVKEKVKSKVKGTSNAEDDVAMETDVHEGDGDLVLPASHKDLKTKDLEKETSPTITSYDFKESENKSNGHRDTSDREDQVDGIDVDDVDIDIIESDGRGGGGGDGVGDDNDDRNINDGVDDDDDDDRDNVDGCVVGDDEDEDGVLNDDDRGSHHQDDSVDAYGDDDDDNVIDGGDGIDDDIDDDDDISLVSMVRDKRHKINLNSSSPVDNLKQHLLPPQSPPISPPPPPSPPQLAHSGNDNDDDVVDINDDNDEGVEADNDDDDDEDDDVITRRIDSACVVGDGKGGKDGIFRICNDDDDDDVDDDDDDEEEEFDAIVNKKKRENMMKRKKKQNSKNKMNDLETDDDDDDDNDENLVDNNGGDRHDYDVDDDDDDDVEMKTVNINNSNIEDIGIADNVYVNDDEDDDDAIDVDNDDSNVGDIDDDDGDANNSNLKFTFKKIGHRESVIETNLVQGLLNSDDHEDDDDEDIDDNDDDDDGGGGGGGGGDDGDDDNDEEEDDYDDYDDSLSLSTGELEKKSSYFKRKSSRNSGNTNNIDEVDLSSSVSKETDCGGGNNTRS